MVVVTGKVEKVSFNGMSRRKEYDGEVSHSPSRSLCVSAYKPRHASRLPRIKFGRGELQLD